MTLTLERCTAFSWAGSGGRISNGRKVCGILKCRATKHRRKKKACCLKVGCDQIDMRISDLIQDEALRRAIENHNKKRRCQS